jgi:hypothetical protein
VLAVVIFPHAVRANIAAALLIATVLAAPSAMQTATTSLAGWLAKHFPKLCRDYFSKIRFRWPIIEGHGIQGVTIRRADCSLS